MNNLKNDKNTLIWPHKLSSLSILITLVKSRINIVNKNRSGISRIFKNAFKSHNSNTINIINTMDLNKYNEQQLRCLIKDLFEREFLAIEDQLKKFTREKQRLEKEISYFETRLAIAKADERFLEEKIETLRAENKRLRG